MAMQARRRSCALRQAGYPKHVPMPRHLIAKTCWVAEWMFKADYYLLHRLSPIPVAALIAFFVPAVVTAAGGKLGTPAWGCSRASKSAAKIQIQFSGRFIRPYPQVSRRQFANPPADSHHPAWDSKIIPRPSKG